MSPAAWAYRITGSQVQLLEGEYVRDEAILIVEDGFLDRDGMIPDRVGDRRKLATVLPNSQRIGASVRRRLGAAGVLWLRTTALSRAELVKTNRRTGRSVDFGFVRDYVLAKLGKGVEYTDVAASLAALPGVKAVFPSAVIAPADTEPDDTHYGRQWFHERIRMPEVWDSYQADGGLTVGAFEQEGIKGDHPDLEDNVDTSGVTEQYGAGYNHGTSTAGVVCAVTDNGEGVAGVSWNAKVLISGGDGPGTSMIDLLFYLCDLSTDSDVIYHSWSIKPAGYHGLDSAFSALDSLGIFQVSSAGNDTVDLQNTYLPPASHEKVLMVGATDSLDNRAPFSNYYSSPCSLDAMVYAPGEAIYTTTSNGAYPDTFWAYNGTSYAAPIVAGVAALMLDKDSSLTPAQIREKLIATADTLTWSCGSGCTQYGKIIDAKAALDAVSAKPVASGPAVPTHHLLGRSYPNPFNPSTSIPVSLDASAVVRLEVHNSAGQLVRTIELGDLSPGQYTVSWDGTANDGTMSSSGVCLYRLTVDGRATGAQKMLLLR